MTGVIILTNIFIYAIFIDIIYHNESKSWIWIVSFKISLPFDIFRYKESYRESYHHPYQVKTYTFGLTCSFFRCTTYRLGPSHSDSWLIGQFHLSLWLSSLPENKTYIFWLSNEFIHFRFIISSVEKWILIQKNANMLFLYQNVLVLPPPPPSHS